MVAAYRYTMGTSGKRLVWIYESLCVYWKWPSVLYKCQLVLALLSCFVVNLSVALTMSYGNLLPYVVAYIRVFSRPQSVKATDAVYVYFMQCFGYTLFLFIGGFLVKRLGPRVVTVIGGALSVAGISLSYFTISMSFYLFLVTYGLLFGAGCGLVFISSITCAVNWLPTRKGLAMAISTSGFGSGPILYNALITGYVNPHNESPNYSPFPDSPNELYYTQHYILMRVRTLFLVLAMVGGSLISVSCVFLVNPHPNSMKPSSPAETGSDTTDSSVDEEASDSETFMYHGNHVQSNQKSRCINSSTETFNDLLKSSENNKGKYSKLNGQTKHRMEDYTPLQMMYTCSFYLLWVKSMIGFGIAAYFITLYKTFALQMVTKDDFYIAFVGTLAALFNVIGRFFFGFLEDFIDIYFVLSLQNAIMTCLLFTFYATSAGGEVMFLFWVSATFFCAGGYYSLYPTAVVDRFGMKNMSVNFGIVNTSVIFGELFTAVVSQLLIHTIQWYGTFFLFGGISSLDFLLSILYAKMNSA